MTVVPDGNNLFVRVEFRLFVNGFDEAPDEGKSFHEGRETDSQLHWLEKVSKPTCSVTILSINLLIRRRDLTDLSTNVDFISCSIPILVSHRRRPRKPIDDQSTARLFFPSGKARQMKLTGSLWFYFFPFRCASITKSATSSKLTTIWIFLIF